MVSCSRSWSFRDWVPKLELGNQRKVYLAPAIKSENVYESTSELLEAGASMIWNASLETAYVKLLLAYGTSNDERQIEDFINEDIVGEQVS